VEEGALLLERPQLGLPGDVAERVLGVLDDAGVPDEVAGVVLRHGHGRRAVEEACDLRVLIFDHAPLGHGRRVHDALNVLLLPVDVLGIHARLLR
jgi:hypothetical protein